jgi:hypothetical protein
MQMIENKDAGKKQLLLRLAPSLWQDLAAWAEDDFRSINGQIEFLLSESVKQHKKGKNKSTEEKDKSQ